MSLREGTDMTRRQAFFAAQADHAR